MSQTNTLVKAQKITSFKRSLAIVIGINEYQNKIPKLQTARPDAEVLAQILAKEHQYDQVILITDQTECKPTLKNLLILLEERLLKEIQPTKDDRLLFYFAGHGIAGDSDKGPVGYLVPQDADLEKNENLLPMQKLHNCLTALSCRHLLVILDCCFAGTFRWSTARLATVIPAVIRKEHYDRFIKSSAWQAITSAAYNQEALDIICLRDNRGGINHSPFALALFKALRGEGDVIPAAKNGKSAGDGVITATELYLYLRDNVETASHESQTPGIWTLSKHDKGEYIFLVPGAEPKLKPAPKLNEKNNPYRGLQSFEEGHSQVFFGRKELVEELYKKVSHTFSSLTVVLGVSGSGKSSLVKAGLIPYLRQYNFREWYILKPMRPSEFPFTALARTLLLITNNNDIVVSKQLDNLHFIDEILQQEITDLNQRIDDRDINSESDEITHLEQKVKKYEIIADIWKRGTKQAKQLLIVNNFDELNNLYRNEDERTVLKEAVLDCLNPLSQRLQDPNEFIKIVKTWSEQRPGIRLLLVIDQFEELITLSSQSKEDKQNKQLNLTESQQFLKLLEVTSAVHLPQLSIVVTLRSDFEPRFLNSEALKLYWTHARFPVRAMRSDELRQAIERPAAEMALYFEQLPKERNPVDKLVDEVGQMPAALPLLSFTLSELYVKLVKKWKTGESSDRALILDAEFDKEGGVAGSLTRRANKEYDELPDDAHRATMRRVMVRMVTIEGGQSARRRVPKSELVYADKHDPSKPDDKENKRVELVLERLNEARLIVSGQETGEPYVEPAHDFLIKSWDKLQKWQQQEQEDLPLQRRLTPAAQEWKTVTTKEQPTGFQAKAEPVIDWLDKRLYVAENLFNNINAQLIRLWRQKQNQQSPTEKSVQFLWNANPYLDVLNENLNSNENWFNQVEAEFVQQSVLQKRRNKSWRWRIALGIILTLSGLTLSALISQRNAQIEQIEAFQQASEAEWRSNQDLEAGMNALRASKALDQLLPFGLFKPDAKLARVRGTLQKVSYTERVKEYNRLQVDSGELSSVVFSPDGQTIAVASTNETVTIWSIEGIYQQTFTGHDGEVTSVAFSPDGQTIATASKDSTVKLWKRDSTGRFETQPAQTLAGHDGEVTSVAFSPDDGQTIATASRDSTVKLWKRDSTGRFKTQPAQTLTGHDSGFTSIAFSPDGQTIATASDDSTVKLWSIEGQELQTLSKDNGEVTSVAFSPNGQMLVASANYFNRTTIKLWQRDFTGKFVTQNDIVRDRYVRSIRSIAFSPDGQTLALGTEDKTVILLNLLNLQDGAVQILTGYTGWVSSVAFSPDKNTLTLASSSERTVKLWRLEGKKLPNLSNVHGAAIWRIAISPNGKMLASASFDQTVKLWKWDDSTGQFETKAYKTLSGHGNVVKGVAFSPNGQTIATASEDRTVKLWSIEGIYRQTLTGHDGGVISVAFSPDGQTIATASKDSTVKLWKQDSTGRFESQPAQTLTGHTDEVISVAFSPDGQTIVTASKDTTVKLWNLNESKEPQTLTGHKAGVSSVVFSPDGNMLASASDETIKLWKRDFTGQFQNQPYKTLTGHTSWVNDIAFSPEGNMLASAGEDTTVKLWTLEGKELQTLYGHGDGNWIRSIVFTPNGKTVVSAGAGKVIMWNLEDLSLDKLMEPVCNWVRDYLQNNTDVSKSDRRLCDGIGSSDSNQRTTDADQISSSPSATPSPLPSSSETTREPQETPSLYHFTKNLIRIKH